MADIQNLPGWQLGPSAFVFGGEKPQVAWRINVQWRRVLAAAKVRYRNPEQARHTFASTLLSRNAPLVYAQKQGGWKSAAVLLRVYSRWIEQALPAPPEPPAFPAETEALAFNGAVNGNSRAQLDASETQVRPETLGATIG